MQENDLQDLRRKRLAAWIEKHGGLSKLLSNSDAPPSYPSFISQVLRGYSFGSRAARTCEAHLGMPSQFLDLPNESTPTHAQNAISIVRPRPTLPEALIVLGEFLAQDMPDDVREDAADALAKLARRKGALRDQLQVVQLLEPGEPGMPAAHETTKRAA